MTVELKEFVERSLKDVLKAVYDAGEDPQIGKQVAPWGIGGAKFPESSGAVPLHNGLLTRLCRQGSCQQPKEHGGH
jgi:hypothetical protein